MPNRGPGEGMALVGVLPSWGFQGKIRPITLGTWEGSTSFQFSFLQIAGYLGLRVLLGDAGERSALLRGGRVGDIYEDTGV